MRTENLMEESEVNILHTYNRFPVVLDRGEGVYLYHPSQTGLPQRHLLIA